MRDTKKRFSFSLANVSRVSNFIREKSKCVRYLAQEDININLWQRVKLRVVSRERESHVLFLRSLFCVCLQPIKFFSLFSKSLFSVAARSRNFTVVFLGDLLVVHVRFCCGVFFNEHNARFTKKSREKLFLVSSSSFFVGITQ